MILTKLDNDIIIKHQYEWNKSDNDKIVIDVYINSIEFLKDDIVFNCTKIKPIIDNSCGITEDTIKKGNGDIGDNITVKLSQFDNKHKIVLNAAIREIKINKLYQ